MKLTDQVIKVRIVLFTAALSLVGFVLELGPVGGIFSLATGGPPVVTALSIELVSLGFLGYLALAASAAVGLHLSETEPTLKEDQQAQTPLAAGGAGRDSVGEAVRVRPELHQIRMLFTALGGYALLKGISLALMGPLAARNGVSPGQLFGIFEFGFVFVALGWFVLWQFLRWYAQRRRWVRLQDELVGVDVTRIIAIVILLKPLMFVVTTLSRGGSIASPLNVMALLLHLALVAIAALLWLARPFTLRRTLIGLSTVGVLIVVLTIVLAVVERVITAV